MKIDDYSFGHISIEGKAYNSDVIIFPDNVQNSWWRDQGHRLQTGDLDDVVRAKPQIVVVGTGYYGRMEVPKDTKAFLESKGIQVHTARTGDAVTLFNKLQVDCASVVAALHLTC